MNIRFLIYKIKDILNGGERARICVELSEIYNSKQASKQASLEPLSSMR